MTGVCLHEPSYAKEQSEGRSLAYRFKSVEDRALAWGGGEPVQLYHDSGPVSDAGPVHLADNSKQWPAARDDARCPTAHWVTITAGKGAGQTRRIIDAKSPSGDSQAKGIANTLIIVPSWAVVPDSTSRYVITKAEVTLKDVGGVEMVSAGTDAALLPAESTSDDGITVKDNGIYGVDPQYLNPDRLFRLFGAEVGVANEENAILQYVAEDPEKRIDAIRRWLFEGFTPRNPALKAAHDGGWIGALPGRPR